MVYRLTCLICRIVFKLGFRWKVEGRENILKEGPLIVVANHTSVLDGFVLVAAVGRRVTFFSSAHLFKRPVVGWFLKRVGSLQVNSERQVDIKSIKRALQLLANEKAMALFPEGKVSVDGTLKEGNFGAAFLAAKSGAFILPLAIKGAYEALPVGKKILSFSKITVKIGKPFQLTDRKTDRESLNRATQQIMQKLAELLNVSSEDDEGIINCPTHEGAEKDRKSL
ncbi:lysophospholipid acyltransferase family protein [Candidatus Oleimmundimicrobium sp.]|uniref:lysophospholipid acyltransferase family protein n=1 Tax=Candidatus Oleimmundimicrobium sp. TaxID=3060597 RepID=UPI002717E32A|nr:lysophospholipid acyltransferase family protein [Candidatus Oleimmundimicrobium sp.]MDO8886498.1 lysophospholipid acyltransferase family protein [Candidatus Oleimmundimicrobium sp.]